MWENGQMFGERESVRHTGVLSIKVRYGEACEDAYHRLADGRQQSGSQDCQRQMRGAYIGY